MISPSSSFWLVRALNCLQNSMMLICAWPSAGPTGGAGVALPAAICSFTEPVTFFAIDPSQDCRLPMDGSTYAPSPIGNQQSKILGDNLLHLPELQLDGCRSSENRDHHLQSLAVFVDLVHHTRKAGKRAFGYAHALVLLELDLELGLVLGLAHAIHDVLHFFFRERRGLLSRADESSDARRGLHDVPDVVVHVHFNQHIAGIEHAFAGVLLAAPNFG